MDIQDDKDFAALPEIAKLYQACKERDLTIAEREYLKGARDAWQAYQEQQKKIDMLKAKVQELWTELDDRQSKEHIIERCESIIQELLKE